MKKEGKSQKDGARENELAGKGNERRGIKEIEEVEDYVADRGAVCRGGR